MYLLLLFVSFLVGVKKFKHRSADKYILLLLATIFISECLAEVFRKVYKNNMPVYHFLSPLHLLITSLYFNYSLPNLKKKNFGWIIGGLGLVISVLCTLYLQNIYSFPSVFLLFESFCIISLCMLSYFSIFRIEDFEPTKHVFFWVTTTMLTFWSFTFIIWGMISVFLADAQELMPWTYLLLYTSNFLYYGSIGVIFLNYNKLIPSGE
jgi:hypothetical protein